MSNQSQMFAGAVEESGPWGGTFNPWEGKFQIVEGVYEDDPDKIHKFSPELIPYGERLETVWSSNISGYESFDDQKIRPDDVIFLVKIEEARNGGFFLKPQSCDNDLLCNGRKSKRFFHLCEADKKYILESGEREFVCRKNHIVVSDKLHGVSFVTIDIYATIMRKYA